MTTKILLTGRPGVGKTTMIKRIASHLGDAAGGFYTEEARDQSGKRIGFRIITLDGERSWLARLGTAREGKVCLGRYAVDVAELERLGVAAVRKALEKCQVVVIDEIGPMELFSHAFKQVVLEALSSPMFMLATIMARPHPFADHIKKAEGVKLVEVTRQNREVLVERVIRDIL